MTAQKNPAPYKVLLVDDEENIVRSIARLLLEEDADLEVVSANSGMQGIAALGEHPDVALILKIQRGQPRVGSTPTSGTKRKSRG